jgi:erythromycin esterase-like protein
MEIKKPALYAIFFTMAIFACNSTDSVPNHTTLYNLDFKLKPDSAVYHWRENAAYLMYIPLVQDSIHISKMYYSQYPFADCLYTEMEQRVLLPENQAQTGKITIESKGKNIEDLTLIIDGIDRCENIISSDTIIYSPDSILSSASKEISLSNAELLNFKIRVTGKKKEDAYVIFSKLGIALGNRDIDTFTPRKLSPPTAKPKYLEIDTANYNNAFHKIEDIKTAKIIALGEPVHNNDEIQNFFCQFAVNQVKNNNCKLILIEKSLEQTFVYNRYIYDADFEFDKSSISNKPLAILLDTLREYNSDKAEKDKVSLFGMDYNYDSRSAKDISDYLALLNKRFKLRELDELANLLVEKTAIDAINYITANKNKLETVFLSGEADKIIHILHLSDAMGNNYGKRFEKRDSVMFVNAKLLINTLSDSLSQTLLYGHAAHINTVSTFPAVPCRSVGNYMKHCFGDKYLPLAILIGHGQASARDVEFNFVSSALSAPDSQSIEYALDQQNTDCLYLPMTEEWNQIVFSRFKGSGHFLQEFFPMNMYQRYKGVFYIKGNAKL